MEAQDVMTTVVVSIRANSSVQDAAKLMLERRISALPVVDGKDRVVGVVSEGDLMRRPELGTDAVRSWWLQMLREDAARDWLKLHGTSVGDVMTAPAVTVRRATPLKEVARILEEHRIKRVPVLDAGRLVGIVSRADLVRKLASAPVRPAARTTTDRALRLKVLKQVAQSEVDARYVNVTVEHSSVHLWGSMRSNGEQKALRAAVKRVEGVRRVHDHTSVMPLRVAIELGAPMKTGNY
jgi:CBS domain-containing protein